MLLDSYGLTKELEELTTLTAPPGTTAPTNFVKRVTQTMSRIYPLLKTLQVRPSPPESLVQAYLIHIADKSDTNFRKILDLKGISKKEQGHLIELFVAHKAGPRHDTLPLQNPLLTSLNFHAQGVAAIGSLSSASALGNAAASLPARFDPTTLGSALITAARDGVDRFGSPANAGSRSVSPPPTGVGGDGGVKQNLSNLGKFFKKDIGGRFGGGVRD